MNRLEIELEEEAKHYEVTDTWQEDAAEIEVEVKRPLDKVIPIRLSADKWEALRAEAKELGLGPTTLARMWIMEKLRDIQGGRRPPDRAAG